MTRTNVNNQIASSCFYAIDQMLKKYFALYDNVNIHFSQVYFKSKRFMFPFNTPYLISTSNLSINTSNTIFGGVLLQGINVLLTSPK